MASRMWVVVLVLLVSACGAEKGTPAGTPRGSGEATSFAPLGPEPSGGYQGGGGGKGKDNRAILVGGPRLDGRTDSSSWPYFFQEADGGFLDQCKVFRLGGFGTPAPAVPVSVSVHVGGVFGFASSGSDPCSGPVGGECRGYTFPAGAEWDVDTCSVQIVPSGPGEGALSVEFSASCPSAEGLPCDDPAVAAAHPSASDPVAVGWKETVRLIAAPCTQDQYDYPTNSCVEPTTTTTEDVTTEPTTEDTTTTTTTEPTTTTTTG